MNDLKVRSAVRDYRRDSYLGEALALNHDFEIIDCAVGYGQWGMSAAARAVHDLFDPRSVTAYPELFYDRLLKPGIMRRFGLTDLPTNKLFFGHGSFNLAERLIHKLIEPSRMLGIGPQFNEIPSEFVAAGGSYHTIELGGPPDFTRADDELIEEIAGGSYSMVYIDNPNNPTGSAMGIGQLDAIAATAEHVGTIVLIDEAYGDFLEDHWSAARMVGRHSNVAVIRSFSKCLGLAAERVGYLFLSKELADIYRELDVPFEPTLYAASLAAATTEDTSFANWVRDTVTATKIQVSLHAANAGFTILPTHPSVSIMAIHHEEKNVAAEFAAVGVATEPGSAYIKTHHRWNDSYARIRIPRPEMTKELCARIKIIGTQKKKEG